MNKSILLGGKIITVLVISLFLSFGFLAATNNYVSAASCDASSQLCSLNHLPGYGSDNATQGEIQTILSIVFGAMGSIALLMVVLAGFKYVTSAGNPQELSKAKNALIYAGVGLIVSALAFTLVTFVINSV
jgi:hypothetical protein